MWWSKTMVSCSEPPSNAAAAPGTPMFIVIVPDCWPNEPVPFIDTAPAPGTVSCIVIAIL